MSNIIDPESVQFLRESESQPLGVAELTARERMSRVAASVQKLQAELVRRGIFSSEHTTPEQEQQARAQAAVKAAGITLETHPPQVVELAIQRKLSEGREAADVATSGDDAAILRAQFGTVTPRSTQNTIAEDYRNAA